MKFQPPLKASRNASPASLAGLALRDALWIDLLLILSTIKMHYFYPDL